MKFLIAGLGSIGRRHFRNLIALGEKDIVLLRTRRATLPDDELAGYPVETDLQEALKIHKPDAVIVSNPTAFQLEGAIRESSSKVLVAFQFRFHPGMIRAKQLIDAGEIGRIISAHVHFGEY